MRTVSIRVIVGYYDVKRIVVYNVKLYFKESTE